MEKFSTHTGIGVPLRQSDVDTDQIIPAAYLKSIRRTGFGEALFARWRKREDFILNQEPYLKGSILVAGPNFGSGSSREHAVWALRDYGFKVVLSCRFADIFRENSGKQGLVAAVAGEKDIAKIWRAIEDNPGLNLTVDLEERCVTYRDAGTQRRLPFQIDGYTRWRLMNGFDDIDLTLRGKEEIESFELTRPSHKPKILSPRQR